MDRRFNTTQHTQGKHIGRINAIDITCSVSVNAGCVMTVHKSQCVTIPGHHNIYEHKEMSKNMLYVSMTRATNKGTYQFL